MNKPASPTHVTKRDGSIRPFDLEKIVSALERAGRASGEFDVVEARAMALHDVLSRIEALGAVTPHIEQLQDIVESTLHDREHRKTLRAYIVHREQHRLASQWNASRPNTPS